MASKELKDGSDIVALMQDPEDSESQSIVNAQKGFQAMLAKAAGVLGEKSKREELESKNIDSRVVETFLKAFREAVMGELGTCEYMEKSSDRFIYGRNISMASNYFLRVLRNGLNDEKKPGSRLMPEIGIDFDEEMMTRLAEQHAQAAWKTAEEQKRSMMLSPLSANLSSRAFQRVAMPPNEIRASKEYIEVMAKLKREGKIL